MVADKAYSHPSARAIKEQASGEVYQLGKSDQVTRRQAKGAAGGRPLVFDQELYRGRNVVERCFAGLKQFLDLATCYAKRAAHYAAEVIITAIVLWLRCPLQDRP